MAKGFLIINTYADNIAQPIEGAEIEIVGQNIKVKTDKNGQTPKLELPAPNIVLSQKPQDQVQPYATYDITVKKIGLIPTTVSNVQIYPDITSTQDVYLQSIDETSDEKKEIEVAQPTLWGEYAPPLASKAIPKEETRVLTEVIIPSYIIVHDGVPSNSSAPNYEVSFIDYIKNVACSEIYATWPKETIKANVAAIVSFTLNRIYTEWYRVKGYNFTITSSTAYDQKYSRGRTLFDSITKVIDEFFTEYIRFPNRSEPFLAHYNDGIKLNNPGWLNQWESKNLGDQGYNSTDILKTYYGNSLIIDNAGIYLGYPTSFPGYNLKLDACGEEVQKMQNELNKIRGSYPGIPIIPNPNGIYNKETETAVKKFQQIFSLPQTGIIDFSTWYKISYIYTAVTRMTEAIY